MSVGRDWHLLVLWHACHRRRHPLGNLDVAVKVGVAMAVLGMPILRGMAAAAAARPAGVGIAATEAAGSTSRSVPIGSFVGSGAALARAHRRHAARAVMHPRGCADV